MTYKPYVVLGFLFGSFCLTPLFCRDASASSPTLSAVQAQIDDGGRRLAVNDISGAIRSLQAALREAPDNPVAAQLLTVAYLHSGKFVQAAAIAQAETEHPAASRDDRATAALLLGTARYSLLMQNVKSVNGQISSFASMKQLLEQMAPHARQLPSGNTVIDPGDDGMENEGAALSSSIKNTVDDLHKTLTESEDAFRLALTLSPDLPGAHDGLGLVLAAQGYTGEARQNFLAEMKANGPSGLVYLHLAEIDLLHHQDDDADQYLRLAANLSPEMETPYIELAGLYEKQKDKDHAQWARGMAALKRGDLRSAENAFAKASGVTSDLLCAKAQLALQQKRSEDARGFLAAADATEPHKAEVALRMGDVEAARGRYDAAIEHYRQALELDDACGAAWYGIGLAYDALNNHESAVADFRQALQFSPNDPAVRLRLADDEAEIGQAKESAADFTDYLRRFPTATNRYLILTMLTQHQDH